MSGHDGRRLRSSFEIRAIYYIEGQIHDAKQDTAFVSGYKAISREVGSSYHIESEKH